MLLPFISQHFLLTYTVSQKIDTKLFVHIFAKYGPVFARDSIYAKRVYAIAIPSVRLSVCLSHR